MPQRNTFVVEHDVKISQVIAALHFVVVSSCLENFLDDAILAVLIPHFDGDLQPYNF